jgi:hypothetical protein
VPGAQRSRRRRLLICLGALVGGVLLAEGVLRWLLFSSSALAVRLGASLRNAEYYVPLEATEDFEKVRLLLVPPRERWRPGNPHPELGWVRRNVDAHSLRHPDEARLQGRRPVLLFGSSFATHDDPEERSYEDLLEDTELAQRFCILNYATFAYGLDQTVLLVERALPLYAELDPIVVVALAFEDLPRSATPFFCAPKPRFTLEGDELRLSVPDEMDLDAHLELHPPRITSYLARYVVFGIGLVPGSVRERFVPPASREAITTSKLLLTRWHEACAASGIEHFAWLFRAQWNAPAEDSARTRELRAYLRSSRIPHVDSGPDVLAVLQDGGAELSALVVGPGNRHPNQRGAEVLFPGLLRGLEGRYDSPVR